jgi:hypothetical protein
LEDRKAMYRSRLERISMKEQTKVSSLKDKWFRSGGYTSTLKVPATTSGVLADKVRESLKKGRQPGGTRTKVLEDGGKGARQGLNLSNQFPRERYTRVDCQLCFHLAAYRAAYAANVQAQPQLVGFGFDRPKAAKSWMLEHTRDVNDGIVGQNNGMRDFKVKVVGKYQKCLNRQVDEDVQMQQYEACGCVLLNSKYEYYMPKSVQPVFRQL